MGEQREERDERGMCLAPHALAPAHDGRLSRRLWMAMMGRDGDWCMDLAVRWAGVMRSRGKSWVSINHSLYMLGY